MNTGIWLNSQRYIDPVPDLRDVTLALTSKLVADLRLRTMSTSRAGSILLSERVSRGLYPTCQNCTSAHRWHEAFNMPAREAVDLANALLAAAAETPQGTVAVNVLHGPGYGDFYSVEAHGRSGHSYVTPDGFYGEPGKGLPVDTEPGMRVPLHHAHRNGKDIA